MTHHAPDATTIHAALETLAEHGFEGMAYAIELLLNEAMKIERSAWLGAGPFERTPARRGYANGYKPKQVKSRLGELELSIPKVRDVEEGLEPFYPTAIERGERSERALKLAVAEMYVQGVSTRKVSEITRELCGIDVSSTQVSRLASLLDEELEAWRTRPLGETPFLQLDARYEKVRHGGHVVDVALLYAVGVSPTGMRSVLGVSASLSEAEVHWRGFLESLRERGLFGTRLITSDDHAGLRAARKAVFPGVPWQRCQFHLQQNAQGYVPRLELREAVAQSIRTVFNAPDRVEADRQLALAVTHWTPTAPRFAAWMEENLPEGLAVFELPPKARRRLRTTNVLERLSREIKRRTRVATLFPNEASLLRLAAAVLVEISEEWETGRSYLRMDADRVTSPAEITDRVLLCPTSRDQEPQASPLATSWTSISAFRPFASRATEMDSTTEGIETGLAFRSRSRTPMPVMAPSWPETRRHARSVKARSGVNPDKVRVLTELGSAPSIPSSSMAALLTTIASSAARHS